MNIVFDLDGTLIDSSRRLYLLFQRLVPYSNLGFEDYWSLKRDKVSNESILRGTFGFADFEVGEFVNQWMHLIESPEFLALDELIPGVKGRLEDLRHHADLHICTARQHRDVAVMQLDDLGLLSYFKSVMVTEQKITKQALIQGVSGLSPHDWMIGDTGKDIQAGRDVGIRTCAVLGGFLSEKSLRPYRPDLIVPSVCEFYL